MPLKAFTTNYYSALWWATKIRNKGRFRNPISLKYFLKCSRISMLNELRPKKLNQKKKLKILGQIFQKIVEKIFSFRIIYTSLIPCLIIMKGFFKIKLK